MPSLLRKFAIATIGLAPIGTVFAQGPTAPISESATWSFQWENDLFAKDRSDRYYTNGIRLLYSRPHWRLAEDRGDGLAERFGTVIGKWLCQHSACDSAIANVVVDTHGGQNMYTPQNLSLAQANPYDRPYAGWLYLGQRVSLFDAPDESEQATRKQSLDVSIGVIGPSAGAGQVQDKWHQLVNAVDPQGWSNQLRDELGVLIVYTAQYRKKLNSVFDTLPYWRVSAGNVFTSAAVGTQFRVGRNLVGFSHFDPVPASVVAPLAATDLSDRSKHVEKPERRKDDSSYAFAAIEARGVARNIFIDGNTWRDHPHHSFISRRPLVGDFTLGFSFTFGSGTRITYGHTWRTREFNNDLVPPPGFEIAQAQRYGVIQVQWVD